MKDFAIEAEQAFLGACLNSPLAYKQGGVLRREHWADPSHAMIYTAIGFAHAKHRTSGVIEVLEELGDFREKHHKYLLDLELNSPYAPNAAAYADIMREYSKLRLSHDLMAATSEHVARAATLEEKLAIIRSGVTAIGEAIAGSVKYKTCREAVELAMAERERIKAAGFVSTTLPRLDQIMRGLNGPSLTVLGARTSTGKSLIGGQIAITAGIAGKPAGLISLEMGAGQIMARMLTFLGERAPPDETPLYIDDSSRDIDDIVHRLRHWRAAKQIEVAVIDYVQIIGARSNFRSRWEQIAGISSKLKSAAMELGIPILVLAQLSREHQRVGRRPNLTDLRECGNLEQDADNVLLLWADTDAGGLRLSVAKHRSGRAGDVLDLNFNESRLAIVECPAPNSPDWRDNA